MKYIAVIIMTIVTLVDYANVKSNLIHAKDYEVIVGTTMDLEAKTRTGKMFSIVSEAKTGDELAQTAMLAAYELHEKHGYDLTGVLLYPNKDLVRTGAYYAQVFFAADNKGTHGVSGIDKTLFISGKWLVKSIDKALSGQELSILNLWYGNQHKFPSKDPYSSSSFDQASLTDYIAKELKIDNSEVITPRIRCEFYKGVELSNWMTPLPN